MNTSMHQECVITNLTLPIFIKRNQALIRVLFQLHEYLDKIDHMRLKGFPRPSKRVQTTYTLFQVSFDTALKANIFFQGMSIKTLLCEKNPVKWLLFWSKFSRLNLLQNC